jgi:hypothetical protein
MKLVGTLLAVAAPLASAAVLGGVEASFTAGCQTHLCDLTFVCIDVTGLEKIVDNPSDCTPGVGGTLAHPRPGWAPIPGGGYNTIVHVNGNTLTWTTSSVDGRWLDFPGNREYIINFPPPLGTTPILPPLPFVSAEAPAEASDNFIAGPAYLAEMSNTDQQLTVLNASCAEYSLLIEVQADLPAEAGASDARASLADADASPSDASAGSADASPSDASAGSADAGSAD